MMGRLDEVQQSVEGIFFLLAEMGLFPSQGFRIELDLSGDGRGRSRGVIYVNADLSTMYCHHVLFVYWIRTDLTSALDFPKAKQHTVWSSESDGTTLRHCEHMERLLDGRDHFDACRVLPC